MADLDSLIKYRKHIVDESQRILSQLYREAERVESRKKQIQGDIEQEKEFAKGSDDPNVSSVLSNYIDSARKQINSLDIILREMEKRIVEAQEAVRAAFAEQKKIEIVHRERQEAEEAEAKKKEDQMFDDIALDGHRRKQESDGNA